MNRLTLDRSTDVVLDVCGSTNEQDAVVLCKSNGVVQLISNLLDKQAKILSKQVDGLCGNSLQNELKKIYKNY